MLDSWMEVVELEEEELELEEEEEEELEVEDMALITAAST